MELQQAAAARLCICIPGRLQRLGQLQQAQLATQAQAVATQDLWQRTQVVAVIRAAVELLAPDLEVLVKAEQELLLAAVAQAEQVAQV